VPHPLVGCVRQRYQAAGLAQVRSALTALERTTGIDPRDIRHGACNARDSPACVATGISKSLLCGGSTALVALVGSGSWRPAQVNARPHGRDGRGGWRRRRT
jgi:hypothetical protein